MTTTQRTAKASTGGEKQIIVRVSTGLHRAVRIKAAKHGDSMASLIRNFLETYIKR